MRWGCRSLARSRLHAGRRGRGPRRLPPPFELEPEIGTGVLDVGKETTNRSRAFIGPADGRERRLQLDVLGTAGQVAVDVSLVDRRNRPLDYFDVLLRHRLVRLPGGVDGFVAAEVALESQAALLSGEEVDNLRNGDLRPAPFASGPQTRAGEHRISEVLH